MCPWPRTTHLPPRPTGTPPDSGILCGAAGLRGPGTVAQNPVNQRAVQKETNREPEPPGPPFRPKRKQPGRRCRVSPVARTPYYGRFSGFSCGLLTGKQLSVTNTCVRRNDGHTEAVSGQWIRWRRKLFLFPAAFSMSLTVLDFV